MNVTGVNAQVSQVTRFNSSNPSVSITSSDPTVLARQEKQLTNQITQLQGQNASPQQIQKLQQAIQTIKNKIKQQEKLAEEKKSNNQPSHAVLNNQSILLRNNFTRGIDIKI